MYAVCATPEERPLPLRLVSTKLQESCSRFLIHSTNNPDLRRTMTIVPLERKMQEYDSSHRKCDGVVHGRDLRVTGGW